MHQEYAPTIVAEVIVPVKPRCSERQRTATARFAQGWCALHLPSLSLALGIGAAYQGRKNDHVVTTITTTTTTECELPPNDDITCAALGLEGCDEAPGFLEEREKEDQACTGIGAIEEPRRSERERHATKRFVEGCLSQWLPRLASALGLAVTDGKVR